MLINKNIRTRLFSTFHPGWTHTVSKICTCRNLFLLKSRAYFSHNYMEASVYGSRMVPKFVAFYIAVDIHRKYVSCIVGSKTAKLLQSVLVLCWFNFVQIKFSVDSVGPLSHVLVLELMIHNTEEQHLYVESIWCGQYNGLWTSVKKQHWESSGTGNFWPIYVYSRICILQHL